MPIEQFLQNAQLDEGSTDVLESTLAQILREMDMSRADPIARIIAKNLIRFEQGGERDPERLRELSTEFLRD